MQSMYLYSLLNDLQVPITYWHGERLLLAKTKSTLETKDIDSGSLIIKMQLHVKYQKN